MSGLDRQLVLVLGGVRSGKTAKAMEIALRYSDGRKLYYLATGVPFDDEMKKRIEKHKMSRNHQWHLIEEALEIDSVIRQKSVKNCTLLVDCLSVWLSNLIVSYSSRRDNSGIDKDNPTPSLEEFLRGRVENLIDSVRSSEGNIVFVGSETGLGVVPIGETVRVFGDISGEMHQSLAIESDRVVFMIAGIAQEIKN